MEALAPHPLSWGRQLSQWSLCLSNPLATGSTSTSTEGHSLEPTPDTSLEVILDSLLSYKGCSKPHAPLAT